jgi:TPR repeat protein
MLIGLLCLSCGVPIAAAQGYDMKKSWEAGRRQWESDMGSFYRQYNQFDAQWKRDMASQRGYVSSRRNAPNAHRNAAATSVGTGRHLQLANKALATGEFTYAEQMEFAYDFVLGRGVKKDTNQAINWFSSLATKGNWIPAQKAIGDIYLGSYGDPADEAKAGQWYLLAAQNGDLESELEVAQMYALGRGFEKNDAEAVRWASAVGSKLATVSSNPSAGGAVPAELRSNQDRSHMAETVALIYMMSGKDEVSAVKWFGFASDLGSAESALYAAVLLYRPDSKIPLASRFGFRYAKVASDAGQAGADGMVCLGYLLGRGADRDGQAALPYCVRAASRGDVTAMRELGFAYLDGKVLPSDGNSAVAWLNKAAAAGDLPAQVGLGYAYLQGYPVRRDSALAAEWFIKTADRNALASFALATLYDVGDGVPIDPDKAVQYMKKAAELGDAEAPRILAGWLAAGGKYAPIETDVTTGARIQKLDLPLLGVTITAPPGVGEWNVTTTILGNDRVHLLSRTSTGEELKLILWVVEFDTCEDAVGKIGAAVQAGHAEPLRSPGNGWYRSITPLSPSMWVACRKTGIANALIVLLNSREPQAREYFLGAQSESAPLLDAIAAARK